MVNYFGATVDPSDNQSTDITFRRVSFGTKITNHWGSAVGLMPFSTQNYQFISPLPIGGTNGATTNAYSEGNGGINRVFWTNSYDFFNHFSIGVNASYLFGSLAQKTILLDVTGASLTSTTSSVNINNIYFDYGIQAYGRLNKKWDWAIGATFANQTDLAATSKIVILATDSTILRNETTKQSYVTIPSNYGVGLSLTMDKRYSFVADYKYQRWTPLQYSGLNYSLEKQQPDLGRVRGFSPEDGLRRHLRTQLPAGRSVLRRLLPARIWRDHQRQGYNSGHRDQFETQPNGLYLDLPVRNKRHRGKGPYRRTLFQCNIHAVLS